VARRIKPISFEDRMSVVDHLDELRTRLIVSLAAFGVAFGLCFWQNEKLLKLIQVPLHGRHPITLSPTEPFTTTLTVSAYAAIIIALPIVLFQLYSFVLPAFSPTEKKVALPLMLMVPFLFIGGVVFAYFIVVPAALKFLLHFNDSNFNIEIRAKDYYSFATQALLAGGVVFQVPVLILALVRLGITSVQKLRKNRRYAFLVIAVVAAALPGVDPVSMLIEMVPLLILYELSILLASWFGTARAKTGDLAGAEGT
jgi:sec-independent protein translocase protein TatC